MNKKFLLAAGLVLACGCQSKQPTQQNNDSQKKQEAQPSGGCCEMQKPKAAPLSESPKTPGATAPQSPVTSVTPEAKVERKAP